MARTPDPEKLPRILEAAARLFAERPFHEARMEDIAARAGVAKGTLYLFFKDKEQLFRAMIAEALGRQLDETESRLAETADAPEKLGLLIRESVRFSDRYPHYLELLYLLDSNTAGGKDPVIEEKRARYHALIEGILREIDATGGAIIADPGRSTIALLGMLHRIMIATPRPWPDDLAGWVQDQFLFGAAGQPGGTTQKPS